jgi:sugar lactone lactonase YvrE
MRPHRFIVPILQASICLAIAASCGDNRVSEPPATAPPTNVITTVAGSRAAFSGDNGPADQANLNGPDAIAVDARGALYIADALNQRIRRVDASGTITTLAGNGVSGSSGDGGPATAAQLSNPWGAAVDKTGTIYFADSDNNRLRTIDATGRIATKAGGSTAGFSGDGGPSQSARLSAPAGVAIDATGNIYIADTGNNRIRRIDVAGMITTVAGAGAAGSSGDGGQAKLALLNGPLGIAVDSAGNFYIADEANSRIRKVDVTGVITTIAGNGTAGFSGDGAQATKAAINFPRAVAVDGAGNVYIADTRNIRVRKVGTDGVITTFAGSGQRGFIGDGGAATQAMMKAPHGLAVDLNGNLLIVDYGNNEIRRVDAKGIITRIAGSTVGAGPDGGAAITAGLAHPRSVAVDAKGNFYISDFNNNCVWKVSPQGIITTLAGTRVPGFSGDGGSAAAAQLSGPHGITADAAGNVYIADSKNNRVRRVGSDGIIVTVAGNGQLGAAGDGGPATVAVVGPPSAVALDGAGNLYISQQTTHTIRRVSPSGIITTIAGTGTAGYSGDGGPATQAQMRSPIGIASDSAGNLYIAEQPNNIIRKVSAAGIITTVAGNGTQGFGGDGGPATNASLDGPFGVAVDRAGNIYLTDSRNDRIRWVHRDGTITTVAGNGAPGFSGDGGSPTAAQLQGPHGVIVDAAGNLLIADSANDRIRRVTGVPRD